MFLDIISFKVIVSNCHKAFINRSQVNVHSANQLALALSHAGAGEKLIESTSMIDEQNQYNVIPHYEELNASRSRLFFQKRKMLHNVSSLAFHDLYPVHYQALTNGIVLVWLGFTGVALADNKKKRIRYSSTNAY